MRSPRSHQRGRPRGGSQQAQNAKRSKKGVLRVDLGWLFTFQNWGPGRKFLEYGENKENHIFTIDNTNGFKKKRSQFSKKSLNFK